MAIWPRVGWLGAVWSASVGCGVAAAASSGGALKPGGTLRGGSSMTVPLLPAGVALVVLRGFDEPQPARPRPATSITSKAPFRMLNFLPVPDS
jgi:hypothetical protein